MKLSKTAALELLNQERSTTPDDGWINHGICVGNTAERIAIGISERGVEISPEKVAILGYLHDIGKRRGARGFTEHMTDGYDYLKSLGYDDELANICLTHSFMAEGDPFCTVSSQLDRTKDRQLIEFLRKHEMSLEEKLIALCDAMCLFKTLTVEQRLVDVVSRHGVGASTQQAFLAAMRLKHYFDEMLGASVYSLFPELLDRL